MRPLRKSDLVKFRQLTGKSYLRPPKIAIPKIRRVLRENLKLRENGYEFIPAKISGKSELRAQKRAIRKFFPSAYSAKIRGFYVPKTEAGPKPKLRFKPGNVVEIKGHGMPALEYRPIDENVIFTGEAKRDNDIISKLLEPYGPHDRIIPLSANDADFKKFGYTGDPKTMRDLLQKWIIAYGWKGKHAYGPDGLKGHRRKKSNHDLDNWFVGFKRIRKGK